ncbi:MAG: hypothetical protein AAGA85_21890 [Bacteroidota bacterium]
MEFNDLNHYAVEIQDLAVEEHEQYAEVGQAILKNLRREARKNLQMNKRISTVVNLMYCHRAQIRSLPTDI